MKFRLWFGGVLGLLMAASGYADTTNVVAPGALTNAVILIIRHAEKPASGFELAPDGQARAQAYVNYFEHYTVDGQPLKVDCIFATADSKGSHRPRLTIEPTAKALGLPIDLRFSDKDFQGLADELHGHPHGHAILIAWHHGKIPDLVQALGGDPGQVIPNAKWPDNVFGWVIQLRYNDAGQLIEAKRINEKLMPADSILQP